MPSYTIKTEAKVIRTYRVLAPTLEDAMAIIFHESPKPEPVKEEDGGETLHSLE